MAGTTSIPQLSDVVERPRLFNSLDNHSNKQVTLIIGQPAQGKSTLIASYLKRKREIVCWLHLDKTLSNHIKLFYKIINGVVTSLKSDDRIRGFKIPQITLGTSEDILRYSDAIDSLLSIIDIKLNLVFDDFEVIEDHSSGFELISEMIKKIPNNVRVFILSRHIPSLRIKTLKMEDNFFILTNRDLAFTFEETLLFFKRHCNCNGEKIDIDHIKSIHKRTEGWAGGLTLVSESLRSSGDIARLPQKLSFDAFSYFSREIYENQPQHIRDFLIKTSIFDTMDPEVLSTFWNMDDVLAVLGELEKRNLFIQKIESNKKWPFFRYNNLFKDFLKRDLLQNINKKEYTLLNNRAGRILKQKKAFEQAVECFYEAGNFKDIADIIKIKATDLLIKGRIGVIKRWIQFVPETMVLNDPWLLFYRTMTRRIKGGKKNIPDFERALELFDKNKNIRGKLLCIAYLIEATVFLRKPSEVIIKWIEKGRNLLKDLSGVKYTWARTILWQQIGLGYIAGSGEIPKGISACRNAGILASGIGNIDLGLNASIIMIFGYVQSGDFQGARSNLKKIEKIIKEGQNPEYRALKNLVNIDFVLKKGNFIEAEFLLEKSEYDIEKFGLIFLYPVFIELKALYHIYINNHGLALQVADHLSDFSVLEGNDFYKGISHRIKAISYVRQNLYEKAENEADKAVFYLDSVKSRDIHFFLTNQVAGLTMMYNKNYLKASKALKKSCTYFKSVSSDLFFTETCLALGLIFRELGDKKNSLQYLETGMHKAIMKNYMHFPVLAENEITQAVFLSFISCKDPKFQEYFKNFMHCHASIKITDIITNILEKTDAKDRPIIIERLKPFYMESLPKLKIYTLGQFRIYKDEKEFINIEWEGTRPKLLLKSIILNGARDIPRDILIDNLWPDSSSKAGEKNFKINLHRLRKALEPEPNEIFGYSYIIHKQGLISLNPEIVSLDIDDFLKFCMSGEKKQRNDDISGAIKDYARAVELYKGDYFVEEPYADWLSRRRELIRNKYLSILHKKALLHEDMNEIDQAIETWHILLDADRFYESAYRNLMIIYADSGYLKKALNIFERCRAIFKDELDSEPSDEISALYNKIKLGNKNRY